MLDIIEFTDKKLIILNKFDYVYVFNRITGTTWQVLCIPKNDETVPIQGDEMKNHEAFEFYKDRMQSFGFKRFPIIIE